MSKVCIICFDFKKENINKQPWVYVKDIALTLSSNGFNIIILTNGESFKIRDIQIRGIPKLWNKYSFLGYTDETIKIIKEENPDVILETIGPSTFITLQQRLIKLAKELKIPVIGLFIGPLYSVRDIIKVGLRELVIHYKYVLPNTIGAFVPSFLIKNKSNNYSLIITPTYYNKKKLLQKGVHIPIIVVPPKIENKWFNPPKIENIRYLKQKINPEDNFLIVYFTSPLTLRGTDVLINAFSIIRKRISSKILILARQDKKVKKEEEYLKSLSRRLSVNKYVFIVSQNLPLEELKAYLSLAHVIVLPFKIIISDFPISILEGMAIKKPVISTDTGGISEVLDKKFLSSPNNTQELADKIEAILSDPWLQVRVGKRNYIIAKSKNKILGDKIVKLFQEVIR